MRRAALPARSFTLLLFLGFAAGDAAAPKPTPPATKSASGCTLYEGAAPSANGCVPGAGECYLCEYSNQFGSYQCAERPDPSDGLNCYAIENQNP
jgi:hypothetical protein